MTALVAALLLAAAAGQAATQGAVAGGGGVAEGGAGAERAGHGERTAGVAPAGVRAAAGQGGSREPEAGAAREASPARAAAPAGEKTPRAASQAPFTEADVAPFLATGPAAKGRIELAAGRYEAAARALERSRQPQARYLRAVALVEVGKGAEAVKALAGLEAQLPDLADRIAALRGRGHELARDDRLAARAYAQVAKGSLLWADAQLARARALARLGDAPGALEALAPILALHPPDDPGRSDAAAEALLLAGRLHAAAGAAADPERARAAFVACWAGHPLAPAAPACAEALAKLPSPHGAPPSSDDALQHAERLLDANHNGPALEELSRLAPALPPPGPDQPASCRAAFALGKAYRKVRRPSKAIEVLGPVVERCDDPHLRARALYLLGSASAIVAPDEGVRWYRALAHDYPSNPLADDALFYAADLLARAGRTDEALATLAELADGYPDGDFRAEALFRAAWIAKGLGRVDEALAAFGRIEADEAARDPYEHARAAYWKARLLAERAGAGDRERARATWRELAYRRPADYYGLLARARLEEDRPGSAPAFSRPPAPPASGLRYARGALPQDRHFRAGVLLLRMGLSKVAAEELGAVDRKPLAVEPALLLAELLSRAGDAKSSHHLVRSLARAALQEPPRGATLRVWRVAYPAAFRAEVERWAPPAGVPPDLLLALMREESGLDPTAMSGAGAVGLTQLMLPTAQDVARRLHLGRIRPVDLTQPQLSIRLGAAHLGALLRRYDGSEALALAAYNAGDGPVRSWLKTRGALPLDAFVEEIPMQETRGYVKRVLRSYAAYRYLYGAAAKPVLVGQALPGAPRPASIQASAGAGAPRAD